MNVSNDKLIKLSPYHKIFYNEWKLDPLSCRYNVVFDQTLSSNLDVVQLESALQHFVADYYLFNCHIISRDNELYFAENALPIGRLEVYDNTSSEKIYAFVSQNFDLETGPLYRFVVFKSTNNYRILLVIHHILMDGSGVNKFVDTISNYYNETYPLLNNTQYTQQKQQIVEYCNTVNNNYNNYYNQCQQFWKGRLTDIQPVDLKFLSRQHYYADKKPYQIQSINEIRFSVAADELSILNNVINKLAITPYLYGQIIFAALLYRYTQQEQIAISYPILVNEGLPLVCGARVNTSLHLYDLNSQTTTKDLIIQARNFRKLLKSGKTNYAHYPIQLADLNLNSKLFNVVFANTNLQDTMFVFNGVEVLKVNSETNCYAADLLFQIEFKPSTINYRVRYDSSTTDKTIIENFVRHYRTLFSLILQDLANGIQDKPLKDYQFLNSEEYNQLIHNSKQPYKHYPNDKTIPQLFEEQVERTPENVALVFNEVQLTYRELNNRANQLANYLKQTYIINGDDLITLCLERSEYMIIAILGVLKSGAAYVPIDSTYPDSRVLFIINDTNTNLLLTNETYLERMIELTENKISVIAIDSKAQVNLSDYSCSTPPTKITSSNLAYVIYTSGSTGQPKGVLQQHNNVHRLLTVTNVCYKFNSSDVWTMFHSYAFDFSVWEMWGALCYGGKLLLINSAQTRDFEQFHDLCVQKKVTVLNQTPHAFYRFMEIELSKPDDQKLDKLRYVIFGGEALNTSKLSSWFYKYGYTQPTLVNMYGITETTVHSTYKIILPDDLCVNFLLGKFLPDQKGYVLDNSQNILPIGAIGELYIGGAGLARGYLNNPQLTQKMFIANPFQTEIEKIQCVNSILYKTGDLVRYLSDGSLEYISRKDTQVKINGYRIELGEIEHAINNCVGVSAAAVIAQSSISNNNKSLIGYYTIKHSHSYNTSQVYTTNIANWESLYDSLYRQVDYLMIEHDFSGWNSYITGLPIPLNEMNQWHHATIKVIKSLAPTRIFEIGSGSGLLMYSLLSTCEQYTGIDFSKVVIERHNAYLRKHNRHRNVTLYHLTADKIDQIPKEQTYDIVIINSVCQYFPDIEYFLDVIDKSLKKLPDNGSLFIGDVRDYGLHEELIEEHLGYVGKKHTIFDIKQIMLSETELLISPEFFLNLTHKYKHLAVDILERPFSYINELSKYRYDVIIAINHAHETASTCLKVNDEISYGHQIKSILAEFKTKNVSNGIYFKKILNTKLIKDFKPINFDRLGKKYGYKHKIFHYSESGKIYLSVLFYHSCQELYLSDLVSTNPISHNQLYNTPGSSKTNKDLIRKQLMTKLPDYMVPNTLIELENLPLTMNGKLNYNALPKPATYATQLYVKPKNKAEELLVAAYANVLEIEKDIVSITADFFKIGGNSILAIKLVSELRNYFNLTVNDIFKLRSPEKIASQCLLSKNNLHDKLKQIKRFFYELNIDDLEQKILKDKISLPYLEQANSINFMPELKLINNVLLTGVTGHLGCNILYQLLTTTSYKIYLPVRAVSLNQAYDKVYNKYMYYFNTSLKSYSNRLEIFVANLEDEKLGLDEQHYQILLNNIDSIIHSAALVKHYGDYEIFYKANILATINLLELCRFTGLKDFHYISTSGVLMDGYIPGHRYCILHENSDISILQNQTNYYIRTKYLGEVEVVRYRNKGIKSSIYRVGNLFAVSFTHRLQQNIEDNAFFNRIKVLLKLGVVAKELTKEEVSPVDMTALAVAKLFQQQPLVNMTHHVFNPNIVDISQVFNESNTSSAVFKLKLVHINEFIDIIGQKLSDESTRQDIEMFMLYNSWLQELCIKNYTHKLILQDMTQQRLRLLGFEWKNVTTDVLELFCGIHKSN